MRLSPDDEKSPRRFSRSLAGFMLLLALASVVIPLLSSRLAHQPNPHSGRHIASENESAPRKVEILQSKMRLGRELKLRAQTNVSEASLGVPANTRLVAVIDNACASERLQQRHANQLGGSELSLSEIALARAAKGPVPGLKVQAYAFNSLEDMSVTELEENAENDDCVLNLVDERERHLLSTMTATDPLASGQDHLAYLNMTSAWTLFFTSGRPVTQDVIVAIVDTGVDPSHEDLVANFWSDGNGGVGYDFINNSNILSDGVGHGTHVAGLVGAAMNNGKGGTGLMGQHLKIMAVRVIDSTDTGTLSELVNGIHFAADHGASVINLSLGGSDGAQAEVDAINYANAAGAVVTIAAGNSSIEMNTSQNNYPAGYAADLNNAIAVGSVDSDTGKISYFSNYSPNYVYIAAPGADNSSSGVGLLSTYPGSEYERLEGTSMATPLVSAAAAYVYAIAKSGGRTPAPHDVVTTILNSARSEATLTSYFRNGAVLDFSRLAQLVQLRWMLDGDAGTGESP